MKFLIQIIFKWKRSVIWHGIIKYSLTNTNLKSWVMKFTHNFLVVLGFVRVWEITWLSRVGYPGHCCWRQPGGLVGARPANPVSGSRKEGLTTVVLGRVSSLFIGIYDMFGWIICLHCRIVPWCWGTLVWKVSVLCKHSWHAKLHPQRIIFPFPCVRSEANSWGRCE